MPSEFPRMEFGGSPVNREGAGRGVVAASALPYSRGTSLRKGWRKSMWGRFGQRRRSKRGQTVERATNALDNVWGRFGEGRTGRKERAYGSAVWLGAGGVLAMATLILLLLWLLGRGRRSREESAPTSPVAPVPEEDVEAVPPLGGGTIWSSKCGRCSPKGGTTSGRGTSREARGNAHPTTKPARRPAAGRGAARRPIRAT